MRGRSLSHADLLLVAPAALELRRRAACVLRGRWRSACLARRDRAALPATIAAVIDQNPRIAAREALSQGNKGLPYDYQPPRLHIIFRENIPET